MNKTSFSVSNIELLTMKEDEEQLTAFAAVSRNPNVAWIKLVLLDDKPNANKHRIPREEFSNVLKTGIFMPIKVAEGEVAEGHEFSLPVGVMSHLLDRGDHIEALAALWLREREKDIKALKEKFASGEDINISWELTYTHSEEKEDFVDLKGVSMNAATIVGMPAYMGRTNVTAFASNGDNNNMETISLEAHKQELKEQKTEFDASLEDVNTKLDDALDRVKQLESDATAKEQELEELRSFKADVDEKERLAAQESAIRTKFEDAGIAVDDEYFTSKMEALLSMSEAALDFFIQELAAFNTQENDDNEDEASASVPRINRKIQGELTSKDLVSALKDLDK